MELGREDVVELSEEEGAVTAGIEPVNEKKGMRGGFGKGWKYGGRKGGGAK